MLPFITFLGRTYPSYTVLGLTGFFVAIFVSGFRARRYGLIRNDTIYIGTFAGIGLVVGGILLYAITRIPFAWENREFITTHFIDYISSVFGGMVFYGGLFGALVSVYLFCRFKKMDFGTIMKLMIPVVPLAHAIMRVGCFAAGCCHGMEHPHGIAFSQAIAAPNDVPFLPVQLFEAAANLIIFAILWLYTKKERHWVTVSCLYGLIYGFVRFWLEFFRGDAIRGFLFGLSTSQLISIVLMAVCLFLLFRRKNFAA